MYTSYFRNKLNIYRYTLALFFIVAGSHVFSQDRRSTEHLIDYDEQTVHYGFLMGFHQSKYRIEYSDIFTSPVMDSVHSIIPGNLAGFKVGLIINVYLFQYLDLRLAPTVAFYENDLTYRFTDGRNIRELKDATMMELPLLLKYKSVRRRNHAMYLLGGINPAFEAAGKRDEQSNKQQLELRNFNFAIDLGGGMDIYFPLFKFSPELRYSFGTRNMLRDKINDFNINLQRLVTHNLGFYITFEGGPSYFKRRKGML